MICIEEVRLRQLEVRFRVRVPVGDAITFDHNDHNFVVVQLALLHKCFVYILEAAPLQKGGGQTSR